MSKPRGVIFKFRLYVVDGTPNSALALANLTAMCQTYLPDRHEIEVIDVFRTPERALADGIFLTPTLLKLAPPRMLRVIGTLNQTAATLQALGLEPVSV
jgi:circadian clock protein KaiB